MVVILMDGAAIKRHCSGSRGFDTVIPGADEDFRFYVTGCSWLNLLYQLPVPEQGDGTATFRDDDPD